MMKQLDQHQLNQHVTILGWLHIANTFLLLVIGGFLFFLLSVIGPLTGDPDAMVVLPIVAISICGLLVFLALPGLVAGIGLLKRRNWGRILSIIVSVFNLMNFPIGTALAVYTLWVLFQESAAGYFAGEKFD